MLLKRRGVQLWARRLHIYVSMALLALVLFFAITGVTLNRPELFVAEPTSASYEVQVPMELLFSESKINVDQNGLVAFLKQATPLKGAASGFDSYTEYEDGELIEGELSADFKAPGYNGSLFLDLSNQIAQIDTTDYGLIAELNDLHKGRHSGEVWKWVIDLSGVLMVLFVVTGVCLLVPKKKTFSTAINWAVLGLISTLAVYWAAVP
ncbi:PepSY-associated TM helix domain-containing protein [Vibrio sp. Of7-15]|uniref:PepSY-associated TM helix domain-containing protein n=1 Tax=Vibrio sp. Of7-15 TaxID=2724879 RepID=UPI001EF1F4A7|nr:PepSY-associated TM helix domain-containing protein [Vibrio sp. Of7-15]MCG7496029.1 PepSY-associated TM helix domain-containing protein [Vibrio sp. Of7-15]